jgi:CRISPR-associated protein Cas1
VSVVYVAEQGALVSLKDGRFRMTRGEALLREVRVDEVEQLVLLGAITLSSAVTRELLRRQIDTVFLTSGGRFLGRLSTGLSKNVVLRCTQHRKLGDPAFALDIARRFVRAKISNQRRLLLRAQRRSPQQEVAQALLRLRIGLERLDGARTLDELRGHEGKAAADYFGCFGKLLRAPGITFEKRLRRPPPDPVNVLLSFGYTMVGNLLQGLCEQAGFDPHVGALHAVEYGRPSLSLDLLEEFRPLLVDTVVLAALNRREITPAHFLHPETDEAEVEEAWEREDASDQEPGPRRVVFRKEGIFIWVTAMERRLNESAYYPPLDGQLSYRGILREQVYRLARHLEGKGDYEGFEGPE